MTVNEDRTSWCVKTSCDWGDHEHRTNRFLFQFSGKPGDPTYCRATCQVCTGDDVFETIEEAIEDSENHRRTNCWGMMLGK